MQRVVLGCLSVLWLLLSCEFVAFIAAESPENQACHRNISADLLFILDSSNQVDAFSYKYFIKGYVEDIAKRVTLKPEKVRIAVVLFSQQVVMGVDFLTPWTLETFLRQLEALPLLGSTRATGDALYEAAYSAFPGQETAQRKASAVGEPGRRYRVAVLITSGPSQGGTPRFTEQEAAPLLKDAVDIMYSVYLKPADEKTPNPLRDVASFVNTTVVLNSWDELTVDKVDILEMPCKRLGFASSSTCPTPLTNISTNPEHIQIVSQLERKLQTTESHLTLLKKENFRLTREVSEGRQQAVKLSRSVSDLTDSLNEQRMVANDLRQKLLLETNQLIKTREADKRLLLVRGQLIEALRGQLQERVSNYDKVKRVELSLEQNLLELQARFNDTKKLLLTQKVEMDACQEKLKEIQEKGRQTKQETTYLTMSSQLAQENVQLIQQQNERLKKEKVNLNRLIESMQLVFIARIKRMAKKALQATDHVRVLQQRLTETLNSAESLQKQKVLLEKDLTASRQMVQLLNVSLNVERDALQAWRLNATTATTQLTLMRSHVLYWKGNLTHGEEFSGNSSNYFLRSGAMTVVSSMPQFLPNEASYPLVIVKASAMNIPSLAELLEGRFLSSYSLGAGSPVNLTGGWFVAPSYPHWHRGKYTHTHLVLRRRGKTVVRLVFNARNATREDWFSQERLVDAFPWDVTRLKESGVRFWVRNEREPKQHLEVSSVNSTCADYQGYLLILDENSPGRCRFEHSISSVGTMSGNSRFLFTSAWSGAMSSLQREAEEADELWVEVTSQMYSPTSPTHEYSLLFALSAGVRVDPLAAYSGQLFSPPDFQPPYHVRPAHLKETEVPNPDYVVSTCDCWFKSAVTKQWQQGHQPALFEKVHLDLVRFNGSVGVSLVFDAVGANATSWFTQERLLAAHPWNLPMVKIYQFTAFSIEGKNGLQFLMEVVGPSGSVGGGSDTGAGNVCEQRLAYMFVVNEAAVGNCYSQKMMPRIFAVTSDSGIPGKLSEMEEFAQLNVWSE